jgi:hypothetical protein
VGVESSTSAGYVNGDGGLDIEWWLVEMGLWKRRMMSMPNSPTKSSSTYFTRSPSIHQLL